MNNILCKARSESPNELYYYSYSWINYSHSLQAKRVASLHIRFPSIGPLAAPKLKIN